MPQPPSSRCQVNHPRVVVRVPAKVMLFGEYSVLWGEQSLACTLDRYLTVSASLRYDATFELSSDLWPLPLVWHSSSQTPRLSPENAVLLGAVLSSCERLALPGLRLSVRSGWEVRDGLGSSSAVRLGVKVALAALAPATFTQQGRLAPEALRELAQEAYLEQKTAQSFASGYDIATQLQGGLVRFAFTEEKWPSQLVSQPVAPQFSRFVHVYLGGAGAPTQGLGRATLSWLQACSGFASLAALNRKVIASFLALADVTPAQAQAEKKEQEQQTFLHALAELRRFMAPSPSCPQALSAKLAAVLGLDQSWGFKASGAGGEDALLVFGYPESLVSVDQCLRSLGWRPFEGVYPAQGLTLEAVAHGDAAF